MKLEARRLIDICISSLFAILPDLLILYLLNKFFLPDIKFVYLFLGLIVFYLFRKAAGMFLSSIYWHFSGKETYKKIVLNQFLENGYPKFPRQKRSGWFYLKDLFENSDVDTDIRLNACSIATSLDAEKSNGILNFLRKDKIIENAVDSYTKSNCKIKDFSSRPYFMVHKEHRYEKKGYIKFVNGYSTTSGRSFQFDPA
jgi:hypothetical protein